MPKKHKQQTHTAYLECLECETITETNVVPFSPFPKRTYLWCGCEEGARHVDAETGFDRMVQQEIEYPGTRRVMTLRKAA